MSALPLRIANSGTEKIALKSKDNNDRSRIAFPDRTIRVIKVRQPEELAGKAVNRGQARPPGGRRCRAAGVSLVPPVVPGQGDRRDRLAGLLRGADVLRLRLRALLLGAFVRSLDRQHDGDRDDPERGGYERDEREEHRRRNQADDY